MKKTNMQTLCSVLFLAGAVAGGGSIANAQTDLYAQAPAATPGTATLSEQQIEQLVAPISLYPDPLLAQVLPASTYPLDIAAAAQWLVANPNPQQSAIDAQPWDPSVKVLVHYPTVLERMAADLNSTQALGVAFLNQQADVMAAVQTLRAQAQSANVLASTPQQQVITADGSIAIEPANPDEIYVPAYTPIYTDGYWTFGGGLTFGLGFPLGIWLDNDFDWHHRWISIGADWDHGWRSEWRGRHGNPVIHRPDPRGRIEGPHTWVHDDRRPRPVLPPAFHRPAVVDEHRGYPPGAPRVVHPVGPVAHPEASHPEPVRVVKPVEPARPSAGTFGPVNRAPAVERAAARGRASMPPARAPEPARPAPAPRPEPARPASPPPSAFHASAPGHTVQQQSARGNASRGGGGGHR